MRAIDCHIHIKPDDPLMDGYVRAMDRHGVERALCHGWPVVEWPVFLSNESVRAAMTRHRGRIFGGAYLDFRGKPIDLALLVQQYADAGFKAIKLLPNFGWDGNEPRLEPVWAEMERQRMIAFVHCGWLMPGPVTELSSDLARPFRFEVPARKHPQLRFVFAHFGGAPAWIETVTMLTRLPNCYADLCPGWGTWAWRNGMPGLDEIPRDRILYGTDGAGDSYPASMEAQAALVTARGWNADAFLYQNGAALLGG